MAKPVKPEPKFFLVDSMYERGLEYYARTWFQDAGQAQLAGEKSTDYLESAAAATRIAAALPDVKLIFILREPVSRAYSNYLWSRMNGLETLDFEAAIRLEDQRERELPPRLRFARPFSYVSRGMYAELLREYFDRFPRQNILVVRFEDIIDAPGPLAERVHRFLGVEPRPLDADGLGVINPADRPVDDMPDAARRELTDRYAMPNQELMRLLGNGFVIWP